MRIFYPFRLILMVLAMTSVAGCGVTKLWGNDPATAQDPVQTSVSLREQASMLADPVWDIEEKNSFMSQMAGVLVNGARSAGQALDVFDWTENESPETRQAKTYLSQIKKRKNPGPLAQAVAKDIQQKNTAMAAFKTAGNEALDYYQGELEDIANVTDNSVRKDRTKRVFKEADEARRAAVQASKSLRQQASVFEATAIVLKLSDEALDIEPVETEVEQMLLGADELRALAEELDLD